MGLAWFVFSGDRVSAAGLAYIGTAPVWARGPEAVGLKPRTAWTADSSQLGYGGKCKIRDTVPL